MSGAVEVDCASEVRNVEISVVELGEFEVGEEVEDFGFFVSFFVDGLKAVKMLK